MVDIRARLAALKEIEAGKVGDLLGTVKQADVAAAVDLILHDLDIDAAVASCDFVEVARLQNETAA